MIPVLLILAVAYWLAAPDPATAGARTAAGTGARAAAAGARDHWAAGRDGRNLTRTKRRDRWSKGGGFWRNLLRLEHGAIITGKGVKGAAGITRAAVKPVPAAVKAGWVSGRDRHRAKAGNRPVPVALDPPWWRREQVQVQPGNSPEVQPGEQAGGVGPERTRLAQCVGCGHPEIRWVTRDPDGTIDPYCRRCGPEFLRPPGVAGLIHGWRYAPRELDPDVEAHLTEAVKLPRGTRDVLLSDLPSLVEKHRGAPSPSDPWGDGPGSGVADGDPEEQPLDTEEQIRSRRSPAWNRRFPEPLTEPDRRFWTARDGGYSGPLDQDGRQGDPDLWPFKTDPGPTDSTTDPTATPAPTEGDTVFTSLDTDLDDLTTVQDFAVKVADMAEESDFAQLVEFCKNASDEVRDFGADMAGDVAEFEEVAAKIGDLLSELVDAATKVKDRGAELVGG